MTTCHPILFSTWSMERILAGEKVETRRLVRPRFKHKGRPLLGARGGPVFPWAETLNERMRKIPCPYGVAGHTLWVRESWRAHVTDDHLPPRGIPDNHLIQYRDGSWMLSGHLLRPENAGAEMGRWRQGMHMPRWASRLTLPALEMRVERLQDITLDGVICEGIPATGFETPESLMEEWRKTWNGINGEREGGVWEENPIVWVVRFRFS